MKTSIKRLSSLSLLSRNSSCNEMTCGRSAHLEVKEKTRDGQPLCHDLTQHSQQGGGWFKEQSQAQRKGSINAEEGWLQHKSKVGAEQAEGDRAGGGKKRKGQ